MRMRKRMKRFLALLLVLAVSFSYHVQTLASSQAKDVRQSVSLEKAWKEMKEEKEKERRQSSALYNQLLQTSGEPKKAIVSLTEEGEDWAEEYKKKVAEEGINQALDAVKDAAEYRMKHIWKRSKNYYDTKGALTDLADTIENWGSFMGVTDAISKFPEVLELQGETAEEQLMELAVLTAQFGVAAFSVIGMSIGFPFGMLLSLTLELILDMIRSGAFNGLSISGKYDEDYFERQRYKLPDGTNVYKPNIYIYSEEKREATVIFGEPELLTVTIPEYKDGWKVTVGEDSQLTDASGLTYDYLFYESVTEPSIFETESGWRIPADMRKERFEEILYGLGFNERETADFTDFWTEKLDQDTDYIMYPQSTELVELAMPMTVAEKPESLERIWFVFVEDDGRNVEEPMGYELDRGGKDCPYYVIEWGGLILQAAP